MMSKIAGASLHPLRWLNRARHSKGFGIHSPFAFSFITETLRQPRGYAYYEEKSLSRRWRWLMRVIMRLGDNRIATIGTLPPGCDEALAMLSARCATEVTRLTTPEELTGYDSRSKRPLIIIGEKIPGEIAPCLRGVSRGTLVFLTPQRREIAQSLNAMIFHSPDKLIAVYDPGLPCQTFTLNF